MGSNRILLLVLVLICLAYQALSQGYAGTVTTGTGIVPPLKVGSGTSTAAGIGSFAGQANLTGAWSIDLKDTKLRHLELNMLHNRDVLMGYGNITTDDGSQRVTAAGYALGSGWDLFVSVIDGSLMYRLELSPSGQSITGNYNSYSAMGSIWSGTATGSLSSSAASDDKRPIELGRDLGQMPAKDVRNTALTSESAQGATSIGSGHTIRSRSFSSTYSDGQVTTSDVTTGNGG